MSDAREPGGPCSVTIRNEFAMVEVSLEAGPSGPQLKITDSFRGASVTLDAMELEGLCWLSAEERMRLLDHEGRYSGDAGPRNQRNEGE